MINVQLTAAPEASDIIDVTIQAINESGNPIAGRYSWLVWISATPKGAAGVSGVGGGVWPYFRANLGGALTEVFTEADGSALVDVGTLLTTTVYVNVRLPDGTVTYTTLSFE